MPLIDMLAGSADLSSAVNAGLLKEEEPICSTLNPMADKRDALSNFLPSKINAGLRIEAKILE